ncbi:anhydro-N-acetylmuramic acid kinase [Rhodobacteraceae bacterium XHP0102]|nr:anhydro-N-acetylmuramic acid kinase [Rhodobacteraceae bacterium XHP0102]
MKGKGQANPVLRVAGLMSGTSLDGVDAAILDTDGLRVYGAGKTAFRPYSADERAVLRAALGKWQGDAGLDAAQEVIHRAHIAALQALDAPFDLIGFHGQTLAHDPDEGRTHQLGDGAVLARACACPVVWDFRSNDMRMGGQGAPLAPFYHFALAKHMGATAPLAFLNLGGVGNITYVDPSHDRPDQDGALLAFDTGPANAPMDDLMAGTGQGYDANGTVAATGRACEAFVARVLAQGYFLKMPPKSLDRDTFAQVLTEARAMPLADGLASLAEVSARAVAEGLAHLPKPVAQILVCGGGRKNGHLMARIAALTDVEVVAVEVAGFDGDFLEAQAFAYLAARVQAGLPTSAPATTGVAAAIGGGQISRP